MNLLSPVKDIMSSNPITISSDGKLTDVETIFNENRFHHIPVVDDGKLVGMVSKSDYLFFRRGFSDNRVEDRIDLFRLKTHSVADIMTTKLATLDIDDRINVALEVFKVNLFHALPVLDGEKLVGIVTTLDIIRHLADDSGAVTEY